MKSKFYEFDFVLWSVRGDTDNSRFRIVDDQIYLKAGEILDLKTNPTYTVRVRTTDLVGNTVEQALTLQVTNAGYSNLVLMTSRLDIGA